MVGDCPAREAQLRRAWDLIDIAIVEDAVLLARDIEQDIA